MAKFIVVKSNEGGGIELHAMKAWLRQHSQYVPQGMDATSSTSRQLLAGLKRSGWQVEETETEVRLFPPDTEINREALSSVLGDTEDNNEESDEQAFGLEQQLRDFISDNIESIKIKGKNLKLFVDQTGHDGIEYPTDVGFIDVLGIDEDGDYYVFELKRDRGSDRVVGQVTRYMGWVNNTIGRDRKTNGVIVAKQIGSKLRYAALVVPNVFLFEYKVQFFLNEANEIHG